MKRSFSANDISAQPARNPRQQPSTLHEENEEGRMRETFEEIHPFVCQ